MYNNNNVCQQQQKKIMKQLETNFEYTIDYEQVEFFDRPDMKKSSPAQLVVVFEKYWDMLSFIEQQDELKNLGETTIDKEWFDSQVFERNRQLITDLHNWNQQYAEKNGIIDSNSYEVFVEDEE